MFQLPPSTAKTHWRYDDPSGVPEPAPYPRPWRARPAKRLQHVAIVPSRTVRVLHREG